jgi:hypothetical protein
VYTFNSVFLTHFRNISNTRTFSPVTCLIDWIKKSGSKSWKISLELGIPKGPTVFKYLKVK